MHIPGVRPLPAIATTFLLPMLLATAPEATALPVAAVPLDDWAQVTIEQRVIIRIPTMQRRSARASLMGESAAPQEMRWRETKGPKCLPLGRIRGAAISTLNGVTMVTGRNEQVRAHFGKACRTADFYAGFYIEPSSDGALCARRDTLHARNGSTCEIEKFSLLVPDTDDITLSPRRTRPDR